MTQIELPHWLNTLIIVGREDDDDKDDKDLEDDKDSEDDDQDDDKDKDKGDSDNDDPEVKIAALEKALADERSVRRKIEREARKAKKKPPEEKAKDDQEAATKLAASEARIALLAEGFLKKEIEKAVLAEARKQGFIDETDAVIESVLKEIDADQDEEDPSDVEVDLTSVEDAVKALAKKKKHLIGEAGPGGKSGGKFRKKVTDDKAGDTALVEHYPSLR